MNQSLNDRNEKGFLTEYGLPNLSTFNKNSESVFIQSINFENMKIVDLNYDFRVMELFTKLLNEMKFLKEKVNLLYSKLKVNENAIIVQGSLKSMWEEDHVWDKL